MLLPAMSEGSGCFTSRCFDAFSVLRFSYCSECDTQPSRYGFDTNQVMNTNDVEHLFNLLPARFSFVRFLFKPLPIFCWIF